VVVNDLINLACLDMAWVWIVASLVLLWLASLTLCKFLHASTSPFFTTGGLFSHPFSILRLISLFFLIMFVLMLFLSAGALQKKNILLVVAHPDDESMYSMLSIKYRP
jgi:uncharacterized membrane protein